MMLPKYAHISGFVVFGMGLVALDFTHILHNYFIASMANFDGPLPVKTIICK